MEKRTRRNLLKAAAAGSMAAGLGLVIRPDAAGSQEIAPAQDPTATEDAHAHGRHTRPPDGPLSSATVSFGVWPADPANPFDRYRSVSLNTRNVHLLIPQEATIRAGGSVNFVLTGLHQLVIYDDGHEPADVNANQLVAGTEFIDDAYRRIYRGLDPAVLKYDALTPPLAPPNIAFVRDRIEAVQFPVPGRYLVICGFRPHFRDDMYGYVKVLP
jgi:plastocyanin